MVLAMAKIGKIGVTHGKISTKYMWVPMTKLGQMQIMGNTID